MLLPARVAIHTVPAKRVLHDKYVKTSTQSITYPDSKVHAANMGLTWDREDPCGPREPCYLDKYIWWNLFFEMGLKCVEIEDLKLIRDVCSRRRYQWQGQVNILHSICGVITCPSHWNLLLAHKSWMFHIFSSFLFGLTTINFIHILWD